MKRINGFLLVLNSPCPRFSSFPLFGMVSYMHFFQKRTMYQVTKSSLLNSSLSSSSKLIFRPVSKFLLTSPEHSHLYELGQNSLSFSGKISFETYSLVSMLSLEEQHSFHKGLVQKIVNKVPVSQHNTYLKSVLFETKQKIVEYVFSLDIAYKEEVLTAFTIGDMACNSSTTSFTLMMDIKHYFILYDLNMRYGSENLKFVMALGKIGVKTPDYNLLDFAKNAIIIVDGKAPSGASSSTLLSEVKSIYGLESRCAIDFDSSQFKTFVCFKRDLFV